MNITEMKQKALEIALEKSSKGSTFEILTEDKLWLLRCECVNLVEFSFFLFYNNTPEINRPDWWSFGYLSDREATIFLHGAGLEPPAKHAPYEQQGVQLL